VIRGNVLAPSMSLSSQTILVAEAHLAEGYRILRTIRRTLIFKQFFKKITFLPFLLLDCKALLKKNS
jgi:hypothetical protein